jgi:hypothetical protein
MLDSMLFLGRSPDSVAVRSSSNSSRHHPASPQWQRAAWIPEIPDMRPGDHARGNAPCRVRRLSTLVYVPRNSKASSVKSPQIAPLRRSNRSRSLVCEDGTRHQSPASCPPARRSAESTTPSIDSSLVFRLNALSHGRERLRRTVVRDEKELAVRIGK